MDINPNTNPQKSAIDLSQSNLQKHLPTNRTISPQKEDSEISTATPTGASLVSLSEEGRTASFKFDFNATDDNLSRMNALKHSESFANAHASISYENVKNLLD